MPPMRLDVHQHAWTPPLLEALGRRHHLPLVRRRGGTVTIHAAGERPYAIPGTEHPRRRVADLRAAGLDGAAVALSSAVGIENLPRREASRLIEAHLAGMDRLPDQFLAWGPLTLDGARSADVDALLARGCVGVSLPAPALADPVRAAVLYDALSALSCAGAPLFVHPGGPEPGATEASADEPVWWPALTRYVSQMHAAWLCFTGWLRQRHPGLTVVFAMLAGCAPLQAERWAARGGPDVELGDPRVFYDTAGYGPHAVATMSKLVGERQLVYGSDRPVMAPRPTEDDEALQVRAGELLGASRGRES
jgi:6-methylsalicylate decarboxylase